MNTGTIIGIAVGAVVVLLLIALVARAASRKPCSAFTGSA